uniref:Uncharacterized protein n=1 Tax=Rhizophora mucronata TaxID=61149 RepID=A0A2P2NLU0_RHIMU
MVIMQPILTWQKNNEGTLLQCFCH